MMSSSKDDQNLSGDSGLEGRLRNLILSNNQSSTAGSLEKKIVPAITTPAATDGIRKTEQKLDQRQATPSSPSAPDPSTRSPRGGKKRLNQAQRRQMNSQFSVPTDQKASAPKPQPERGFSTSTGFPVSSRQHGNSYRQQHMPQVRPYQNQQHFQAHEQAPQYPPQAGFQHYANQPAIPQPHMPQPTAGWQQFASERYGPQSPSNFYRQQVPDYQNSSVQHQYGGRPPPRNTQLYQTRSNNVRGRRISPGVISEQIVLQSAFLEELINHQVPKVAIGEQEVLEKEQFRTVVEKVCRDAILNHEHEVKNQHFDAMSIELKCFGSLASGYATKGSDMDLALLSPYSNPSPDSSESPIPRILEKKLLQMGFGARLLTRTRVPIIKLCQKPTMKLMSDLLEEREKWETGFIAKDVEDDEVVIGEPQAEANSSKKVAIEEKIQSDTVGYEERLASFQQKPKESLVEYHSSASRLLRKLGGLDIMASNSASIPFEKAKVVTDVCRASINGLSNKKLKARLFTYQSLMFSEDDEPTTRRSLRGVFTQAEGEQLLMSWEDRPLRELSERSDAECSHLIGQWQKLLNTTDMEVVVYDCMLHQTLGRLKRIPSLQLLLLEQGLHENTIQYHERTSRILNQLGGKGKEQVLAVVIAHYLSGIRSTKIQSTLQELAAHSEVVSLDNLALQHRILQLADEYEKALAKNFYAGEDRTDLENYVALLRNDFVKQVSQKFPSSSVKTHQTDASNLNLIKKIRGLPEPSEAQKPRDRYKDHLEFPKKEVGIQCDINFSAHLGIQNTLLLRCYSSSDIRVKTLILFVKNWAKIRAINTPYRGTLSSYGYVLMVLHYLTNIAAPFVCLNLQHLHFENRQHFSPSEVAAQTTCNGYDVRFWRNEAQIKDLAGRGMLNQNHEPLGSLLHGFFEYYANPGTLVRGCRGFEWGREVISLRTMGGILTKHEKGWVGARTEMETMTEAAPASSFNGSGSPATPNAKGNLDSSPVQTPQKMVLREEVKEIRHRYLFAIEDPFEIDHNVARTVTHNGIVAIRDEFRRAWRIIKSVGKVPQEDLLAEVVEVADPKDGFQSLLDLIHGKSEA